MGTLKRSVALLGAAFAIPAAVNFAIGLRRKELTASLPGDSGQYPWALGDIFYQVRGEGQPLLLVHGIGAGESSYEWRSNFDALSDHFRVYAIDLPGFGKSDRRDINYTADLMVLAITDFLRDIVKAPAYVVASSLSSAFVTKIARARPELIEKLVMVCPTGLEKLQKRPVVWSRVAYGALSLPAIGTSVYNGIASYKYIGAYMRENLYFDPMRVTPALVEHYYQSAHQSGGQYALRSFISGLLNCDITEDYPEIQQPNLIVWGRFARLTPVENAQAFLAAKPEAKLRVFEDSGLLPHDEEAQEFNATVTAFLKDNSVPALSAPSSPAITSRSSTEAGVLAP